MCSVPTASIKALMSSTVGSANPAASPFARRCEHACQLDGGRRRLLDIAHHQKAHALRQSSAPFEHSSRNRSFMLAGHTKRMTSSFIATPGIAPPSLILVIAVPCFVQQPKHKDERPNMPQDVSSESGFAMKSNATNHPTPVHETSYLSPCLTSPRVGTTHNKMPRRSGASYCAWCRRADSNRGPTHYECVALPAEPRRRQPAIADELEV